MQSADGDERVKHTALASENLACHGHGPVKTNLLHRRSIVTRCADKRLLQTRARVLKNTWPFTHRIGSIGSHPFGSHIAAQIGSGAGLRGTQGAVRQRNERPTNKISPAKVELQI